jgi:Ca2+-binding RTX toxin-like protein
MRKATTAVLILVFAVVAAGAVAATNDPIPTCHGKPATIAGTDGDDLLRGTTGRDVVWGGQGDDTILGLLANDTLCGGPGADSIHGGRGNDLVDGGAGGGDQAIGDLGDDRVLGGAGDRDEAAGDLGIDLVNGGPGDEDVVHGDYGYDRMAGGSGGGDIASFATAVAGAREAGVWASLQAHRARGDGHDKLFGFESLEGSAFRDTLIGSRKSNLIDGGPGNDELSGGGGRDEIDGGAGRDRCRGAKGRSTSCGKERAPKASAFIQLNPTSGGGAGLQVIGGSGRDSIVVAFDEAAGVFQVTARKGVATGPGCSRPAGDLNRADCPAAGPARWLLVDLGPGDDDLRVEGSLLGVGTVRFGGNYGNDTIKGGPEDDLIQAGPGADKLYGGAGSDGLVGDVPGPTFLYGGPDGDLLAAGDGCAGGAIVGGGGRDDASFAETQAHPGLLIISFPRHVAYVDEIRGCDKVRLAASNEDMEGSFDNDILIGNARANAMLGQPGEDMFFGNGGEDVIDARDGVHDKSIQCGRGRPPRAAKGRGGKGAGGGKGSNRAGTLASAGARADGEAQASAKVSSVAFTDSFDPAPFKCGKVKYGKPVPGLNGNG